MISIDNYGESRRSWYNTDLYLPSEKKPLPHCRGLYNDDFVSIAACKLNRHLHNSDWKKHRGDCIHQSLMPFYVGQTQHDSLGQGILWRLVYQHMLRQSRHFQRNQIRVLWLPVFELFQVHDWGLPPPHFLLNRTWKRAGDEFLHDFTLVIHDSVNTKIKICTVKLENFP